MSNYYDILEISKDATQEEIRRAYKRCALKYHPDKLQDDGSDKFKLVNEAYQILGDPEQRRIYDGDFWNTMNVFIMMMQQFMKTQNKKQLILDITISLADIYQGNIKKITLTTKKRDGTFIQKNIFIPLAGLKTQYVFEKEGDENIDGTCQDIVVNVQIQDDENIKHDSVLHTTDLSMELPITLYEYYEGFEKDITHLDGEVLRVSMPHKSVRTQCHTSYFKNDFVLIDVIKNKGLIDEDGKRGILYVYFKLVLPDSIPVDNLKNIIQ
jgi:DnaJ-class molecular chaperone